MSQVLPRRSSGIMRLRHVMYLVASSLFSFELLFVLYLFAGRYKADPRLQWVPVDLTALFLGLTVASASISLLRRRFRMRPKCFVLLLLGLGFVVYAVASLSWSPGRVYASQKALYIAILTFWPLIACTLLVARDRDHLRRFFILLTLFSSWIALESAMAYLRLGYLSNVHALGGNYLGLGRVVGLGLLSGLGYLLYFARHPVEKLVALVLVGSHFFVLLVLGGRGPLVATVGAAVVPFLVGVRVKPLGKLIVPRNAVWIVVLLGVAAVAVVYLYPTGVRMVTLTRLLELSGPEMEISAARRITFWTDAVSSWFGAPWFGHGIGAWPLLEGFEDAQLSPHNLILELLVELGLLGLALFGMLVWYALRALGPLSAIRTDPWRLLILMLFVNVFLNAMSSGDIPDNRVVFAVLGLMTLPRQRSTC